MLLRVLVCALLAVQAHGATRYVTDRAGAPVKWQRWGPAAIARAMSEKRPIFLQVGFVSSYDVERMHREAFLVGESAEALNAYFVPVLLDAIAHPEVAAAAQRIADREELPLHLILTPKLEPFAIAGPLSSSELSRMLVINANRWAKERDAVVTEGRTNLANAQVRLERRKGGEVDAKTIEGVVDAIAARYEKEQALDPSTISFLLRYATRAKHENIRALAVETLRRRAGTRLYDSLGGGFHRCDGCFEKLLVDQAENALAYLEAWQVTNDPREARIVRATLDYALRDLRPPEGGTFHAAQDAHSFVPLQGPEQVEGAFYAWTHDEVVRLLGDEGAKKVWPALEDPQRMFAEAEELAPLLQKLFAVRQKRPAPFRDPTFVAGWNGLMISALARAASALDVPHYLDAATLAASALAKKEIATAEDHALLVQGLLDLYDASGDIQWLALALSTQQKQDRLFWSASAGRYIAGSTLPEAWHGLIPESRAANAVAAVNLLRIAALTPNDTLRARPQMIFESYGGQFDSRLASAYELSLVAPRVVVVAGDARKQQTHDILNAERKRAAPMRAIVFVPAKNPARERVTHVLPFTRALAPDEKTPAVYECARGECRRSG